MSARSPSAFFAIVGAVGALVFLGCASNPSASSSSASRGPVVPSAQAGRVQTAKTGTVQSVKDCVIRPDLGENYSVGREIGSAVTRGDPLGIAGAVGGVVGQSVENVGRTAPGQLIEIAMDDGTTVTVAQGMEPLMYEGARVTVKITGEMAVVELLEEPTAATSSGVTGT